MFNLFIRTLPITFIRIIISLSPAGIFVLGFLFLRNLFTNWGMHPITHLMAVPIVLGLCSLYNKTIVRFLDYLLKLTHTIAVTVLVLEQPYKGTLFGYSWKEVIYNLIGNTAKSIITIKGVKIVKTLKTALFEKTIINHLIDPGGVGAGNSFYKFIVYNVNMALDSMDEVLVSYTWYVQELFRRHWISENPKKTKISIKTRVQNQAKYYLEGVALYIRVFPKMIVNSALWIIFIEVLIFLSLVISVVVTTISIGFGWWNFLLMFVITRAILLAINMIIIPNLRLNVAIWQFYNQVSKLETTNTSFIKDLIGKLPPLAWVAKQTGDLEFKDVKASLTDAENVEACASDIVPWSECEEAMRDLVNDSVKIFQVKEVDILEPVGGKKESEDSETPKEEIHTEDIIESYSDSEEIPPSFEENRSDTSTESLEDVNNMFNLEMPKDSASAPIIRKVDFGDKMPELVDVDDFI